MMALLGVLGPSGFDGVDSRAGFSGFWFSGFLVSGQAGVACQTALMARPGPSRFEEADDGFGSATCACGKQIKTQASDECK